MLVVFIGVNLGAPGAASVAGADAIPPGGWRTPDCPPQSCPPGTIPYGGSHGGCSPGCAPNDSCESDAQCGERYGAGARCEETRFCLRDDYPGNSHVVVVEGECDAERACPEPQGEYEEAQRCDIRRRCVAPPPAPPSSMSASGASSAASSNETNESEGAGCGGCSSTGVPSAGPAFFAAWLVVRRRR